VRARGLLPYRVECPHTPNRLNLKLSYVLPHERRAPRKLTFDWSGPRLSARVQYTILEDRMHEKEAHRINKIRNEYKCRENKKADIRRLREKAKDQHYQITIRHLPGTQKLTDYPYLPLALCPVLMSDNPAVDAGMNSQHVNPLTAQGNQSCTPQSTFVHINQSISQCVALFLRSWFWRPDESCLDQREDVSLRKPKKMNTDSVGAG
jgi:hypothetical protein